METNYNIASLFDILSLIESDIDMIDHDICNSKIPYYQRDDIEELSYRKWGIKELEMYLLLKSDSETSPLDLMEELVCKYSSEAKSTKNLSIRNMFSIASDEICNVYDMYISSCYCY